MVPFLVTHPAAAPTLSVDLRWLDSPIAESIPSTTHTEFLIESTNSVSKMIARRGPTECDYQESPNGRHSSTRIFGIPNFARAAVIGSKLPGSDYSPEILFDSCQIFRHYIRDDVAAQAIVDSLELLAGPLAFTFSGGNNYVPYVDLTGVFFTTPEYTPDKVGVPDSAHYIDFTLPEHTPFLHLSNRDDRYLLLPGKAGYYKWYADSYQEWLEQGQPTPAVCREGYRNSGYKSDMWRRLSTNAEAYQEIFANGGMSAPAKLPLQRIVKVGKLERK